MVFFKRLRIFLSIATVLATFPEAIAQVQPGSVAQTLPGEIKWRPGRDPGVQFAVVAGSTAPGHVYAVRIRIPADLKVMPHTHPNDRIYTVTSGIFYVGFGDKFNPDELKAFPVGSVVLVPAKASHFHWAKSGDYEVQVSGVGPTTAQFVNPEDDPRKK